MDIVVPSQPTIPVIVQTCVACHATIDSSYYFCPNCGKQLRAKDIPIGIGQQVGVYVLSFLLPPLGLWPAFKYFKQKNSKAHIVGMVAVILTVISLILSVYVLIEFFRILQMQSSLPLQGTNLQY